MTGKRKGPQNVMDFGSADLRDAEAALVLAEKIAKDLARDPRGTGRVVVRDEQGKVVCEVSLKTRQ